MPSRKGSPNKNKAFLLNKLKEMYGEDFNPVQKMAEMAVALHKTAQQTEDPTDQKTALDGWDKVAQYIEPKLKAVEVSGEINQKHTVKIIDLSGTLEDIDNVENS